jgi:hypothetical protein
MNTWQIVLEKSVKKVASIYLVHDVTKMRVPLFVEIDEKTFVRILRENEKLKALIAKKEPLSAQKAHWLVEQCLKIKLAAKNNEVSDKNVNTCCGDKVSGLSSITPYQLDKTLDGSNFARLMVDCPDAKRLAIYIKQIENLYHSIEQLHEYYQFNGGDVYKSSRHEIIDRWLMVIRGMSADLLEVITTINEGKYDERAVNFESILGKEKGESLTDCISSYLEACIDRHNALYQQLHERIDNESQINAIEPLMKLLNEGRDDGYRYEPDDKEKQDKTIQGHPRVNLYNSASGGKSGQTLQGTQTAWSHEIQRALEDPTRLTRRYIGTWGRRMSEDNTIRCAINNRGLALLRSFGIFTPPFSVPTLRKASPDIHIELQDTDQRYFNPKSKKGDKTLRRIDTQAQIFPVEKRIVNVEGKPCESTFVIVRTQQGVGVIAQLHLEKATPSYEQLQKMQIKALESVESYNGDLELNYPQGAKRLQKHKEEQASHTQELVNKTAPICLAEYMTYHEAYTQLKIHYGLGIATAFLNLTDANCQNAHTLVSNDDIALFSQQMGLIGGNRESTLTYAKFIENADDSAYLTLMFNKNGLLNDTPLSVFAAQEMINQAKSAGLRGDAIVRMNLMARQLLSPEIGKGKQRATPLLSVQRAYDAMVHAQDYTSKTSTQGFIDTTVPSLMMEENHVYDLLNDMCEQTHVLPLISASSQDIPALAKDEDAMSVAINKCPDIFIRVVSVGLHYVAMARAQDGTYYVFDSMGGELLGSEWRCSYGEKSPGEQLCDGLRKMNSAVTIVNVSTEKRVQLAGANSCGSWAANACQQMLTMLQDETLLTKENMASWAVTNRKRIEYSHQQFSRCSKNALTKPTSVKIMAKIGLFTDVDMGNMASTSQENPAKTSLSQTLEEKPQP